MDISVIIPVYNAALYLKNAVLSALDQEEVQEVVLVEDGSADDSLSICRGLEREHPRVRCYTHPNHANCGAGASRNLGIEMSSHDFVSFLDGDDYFLPNRFQRALSILERDGSIDAVYEVVGTHFENEAVRKHWLGELGRSERSGPTSRIFSGKDYGKGGMGPYVHTNGWTIRKRLFDKTGLFNPELRLHQDADLFIRFQIAGKLEPGNLEEPVARYRIHDANRITNKRTPDAEFLGMADCRISTWNWARKAGYHRAAPVVLDDLFRYCNQHAEKTGQKPRSIVALLLRKRPQLLRYPDFLRELSKHCAGLVRIHAGTFLGKEPHV